MKAIFKTLFSNPERPNRLSLSSGSTSKHARIKNSFRYRNVWGSEAQRKYANSARVHTETDFPEGIKSNSKDVDASRPLVTSIQQDNA